MNWVYYVKNNLLISVLQLDHSQVFALAPAIQMSLHVQSHKKIATSLNRLNTSRNMLLTEQINEYVMIAGQHSLQKMGEAAQLMTLLKRSQMGNQVLSTWLYPHRQACPLYAMAKEAPQTVACTSTTKGLAELVNLHIQEAVMFSSPPLEWPRPSCPNWLQPMLKTAPKMLTMRQQPFPQLIFLICLPASRRQGISTRRLAYSISQTTTVGFSSFGLSSSGQYISPQPATSPRASHIITELPIARSFAVYSFCWQVKGIN